MLLVSEDLDELLGLTDSASPGLKGAIDVFGQNLPSYDVFLMIIGRVVLGALWLLFHRTRWGVLVRAATQDRGGELNRTASECASCAKNGVCSSASLHRKKRSVNIGREAAIKISIGWSTGGIERTDSLAQIVEGLLRHVFGVHLRCVGTHAHRIATANLVRREPAWPLRPGRARSPDQQGCIHGVGSPSPSL